MYEVENRVPNFDLYPVKTMNDIKANIGVDEIVKTIKNQINKDNYIICFDYYYGINEKVIKDIIEMLNPTSLFDSNFAKYSEDIVQEKFGTFITEDRVNGVFSIAKIIDYFDQKKILELRNKIKESKGLTILYGVGASLITRGDLLVYGSISYQTIKDRFQNGLTNWGANNPEEEYLRKEKRFNFLESRVLDKHKRKMLKECDFIIDCNKDNQFVMITQNQFDKIVGLTSNLVTLL